MTTSPQKSQGSRWERYLRRKFRASGFGVEDIHHGKVADIRLWAIGWEANDQIVIEAKDAANMSIHTVLQRAIDKARRNGWHGMVGVAWQRHLLKPGNQRRSAVGDPVVVMTLTDFIRLAGGVPGAAVLERDDDAEA